MASNVRDGDEHDNVVAKPVIGWSVTTIKDETVLAAIEYADSPSELKTGERKIQFELTLRQSLQLADGLIDVVNHILRESSEKPNVNKALLDQLLEAQSVVRHQLMEHIAERRFHVAEGPDVPRGRSAWSGESNGLCAGGYSFHQIGDAALLCRPCIRSTNTISKSRKGFLSLQIVLGYAVNLRLQAAESLRFTMTNSH